MIYSEGRMIQRRHLKIMTVTLEQPVPPVI